LPVALNPCVVPSGVDADDGETPIETSAAGVTVRVVVPLTVPAVAVMTAAPLPILSASPVEPMVATEGALEDQTTVFVKSWVVEFV
jgi:hypothetical protein